MNRKMFGVGGLVVAALSFACIDRGTPDACAGDSGCAGASGADGSSVAGNAPTGFERCSSSAPADAGIPPARRNELGIDYDDRLRREGRVSRVTPDLAVITTDRGTSTFRWRGPALDAAFAVGDDVQLVVEFVGGLSPAKFSYVRSSSATAVLVDGTPYGFSAHDAEFQRELEGLPSDFPKLVYHSVSCCDTGGGNYYTDFYRCDMSALEAIVDGIATPIPRGTTGTSGSWC